MNRLNQYNNIDLAVLRLTLKEKEKTHARLKLLLGIKTKSQHQNAIAKYKRGSQQNRMDKHVQAFQAYIRIGQDMNVLMHKISNYERGLKDEQRDQVPGMAHIQQGHV